MLLYYNFTYNIQKNLSWTDAHDESLYIILKYSNTLYKQYHNNNIKSKQRLQKYRIPILNYVIFY
jgi:hypothetical protein